MLVDFCFFVYFLFLVGIQERLTKNQAVKPRATFLGLQLPTLGGTCLPREQPTLSLLGDAAGIPVLYLGFQFLSGARGSSVENAISNRGAGGLERAGGMGGWGQAAHQLSVPAPWPVPAKHG